jgi:hypothetical protein
LDVAFYVIIYHVEIKVNSLTHDNFFGQLGLHLQV